MTAAMTDPTINFKAIHGQVAKTFHDPKDGEWKIMRFLKNGELIKLPSSTNCVRPQQVMEGSRRS